MENERRVRIAIIAMAAVFALQFAADAMLLRSVGVALPRIRWITSILIFAGFAVLGAAIGAILSAVRGELKLHMAIVRSRSWLGTTAVLAVGILFISLLYGLLKIAVHMVRPVKYDELFWDVDRALLFGNSPNVLILEALSNPLLQRVFDFLYTFAFMGTMIASFLLIFGWRTNGERIGFLAGSAVLWLAGAWVYFALPSLGPAYAYYEIWDDVRELFPLTQATQNALLKNHLLSIRLAAGERNLPVNLHMGIGAFPSLHVGFHVYVALWLQRLVPRLRLLGWLLAGVVFIGSVITGWHYLIDSIAGAALAWVAWRAGAWVAGPKEVGSRK